MILHTPARSRAEAIRSSLALEQAIMALRKGDVADAERVLRERLLTNPDDTQALGKLAEIAIDARRMEEATVLLRRAAAADPSPARRFALLNHLKSFAGAAVALQELQGFPPALRMSFDGRAFEAAMLGFVGLHDRQINLYRELAKEFPRRPALWMSLGNALKTVGRTEEACAALREAIKVRPTYGEAYWTLANFKSVDFDDHDIRAMRKALRCKLSDEDALHFHFALGKALEDRGNFQPSFEHYNLGNQIRARSFPREQMYVSGFVDAALQVLTPQLFERHAAKTCEARDPIFVLGLHRAGSTLVEQILSSHSMIEGTTELTVMQQLWDRLGRLAATAGRGSFQEIARLDSAELKAIGDEYIERTRPFRLTDRPLFIDKLPANWLNIGLIRLALPNAKIIDARRHPMACGFSNFKQNYASGVAYSYSQESIGRFYQDYWRLMNHVERVQPGAVHRVINERLIDNFEAEVKRILQFVGVPFESACLEFHKTRRAVRTPSAEQVRRPINRDGVDYWRNYERWLDPMKKALGPALEEWDAPA